MDVNQPGCLPDLLYKEYNQSHKFIGIPELR